MQIMAPGGQKTFAALTSVDEINRVNDAQKLIFKKMVADSGGELTKLRIKAYLRRWREALAHVEKNSKVLDIGGGWPIEEVWSEVIGNYGIDYWVHDIDPKIIETTRAFFHRWGMPESNATAGANTKLPHADHSFDVVFSSHCIEHSNDLEATFREVKRVLKPLGLFFFAVPIGFDDSDEHLLYLDINGWIAATEIAGFDLINYHLGRTYPMAGWDLCIIAKPNAQRQVDANALQTLVRAYDKQGKILILPEDRLFTYEANVTVSGRHRILMGDGAKATLNSDRPAHSILLLVTPWSGVVEVSDGATRIHRDLWSRVDYVQAVDVSQMNVPVQVQLLGSSHAGAHAVIHGALLA